MGGKGEKGELLTLIHDSPALGLKGKRCQLLVPADAGGVMPIVYFLHGWGGHAGSYLSRPGIVALLSAQPFLSAFPECFRASFFNTHAGDRYEDYLLGELLPNTEAALCPRMKVGPRAIAGFSLGGLSAFLLASRHPWLFGQAACLAAAFEAPKREGDPYASLRGDPSLLMPTEGEHEALWGPPGSPTRAENDPYRFLRAGGPRLFLSVGTNDYPRVLDSSRRFDQALARAGIPHHYEERPGAHDMAYVEAALPGLAAWLRAGFAGGVA